MKPHEQKMQVGDRAVRVLVLTALLAIGLAHSAKSDTIYTYQGGTFAVNQSGVGPITGSFTLSSPLPDNYNSTTPIDVTPLSYSFTDGSSSVTQANAVGGSYSLLGEGGPPYSGGLFQIYSTDASGNITGRNIQLLTASRTTFDTLATTTDSTYCCPIGGPLDYSDYWVLVGPGTLSPIAANYNQNSPGSWTSASTTVPEPSTLLLLGTCLLGLGTKVLRRKQIV
ncbi:MAG: PEP-CTERM sorting domain-containing protein [Terriglobia bacterium]